ncbi:cytochrome P450 [Nocardioides humi]|uniref:Cytochrome P450 n=1 Tax=Nocardioides humi TaxID=449461 RepID=A0ABN2BG64_9ACTN|nr:cytochrome P450 [Nocardioides humi]
MSSARPLVDFDHHSAAFAADPDGILRALRTASPVAYTDHYGGFYVITGYDEVRQVLLDDRSFSVERDPDGRGGLLIPPSTHARETLLPGEIDPPRHTAFRRLLTHRFARNAVQAYRPATQGFVDECLDEIVALGDFDVVHHLGAPVPLALTVHLLGLPGSAEQRARHKLAVEEVFGLGKTRGTQEGLAAVDGLSEQIRRTMDERRRAPRDDVISDLVSADAPRLADVEIRGFIMNLLAGGLPTTASTTAHALLALHHDRSLRQRLIDDPDLVGPAVDEFVRTSSPSVSLARTVREQVEVGGVPFTPGDRVLVLLPSANVDARRYTSPETIDLERGGQHLAFGAGAHYCLGVHLARLELTLMLTAVLTRLPDYSIDEGLVQRLPMRGMLNGYVSMPAHTNLP